MLGNDNEDLETWSSEKMRQTGRELARKHKCKNINTAMKLQKRAKKIFQKKVRKAKVRAAAAQERIESSQDWAYLRLRHRLTPIPGHDVQDTKGTRTPVRTG